MHAGRMGFGFEYFETDLIKEMIKLITELMVCKLSLKNDNLLSNKKTSEGSF
jgi:hypothetical protein